MKTWTPEELNTFGAAEEIEIAPVRRDACCKRR
jgi:hypothetical protein